MSYYSEEQLKTMGFKALGKNVKISDKASIYYPEKIEVGDNSRIDDFCVISGKIIVGRNVPYRPFLHGTWRGQGHNLRGFQRLVF